MPKPPPPKPMLGSPDKRFRGQIEAAVAEGVALDDMTLRLTLRDASLLARDRNTPVADITYSEGVMRFLGVRVEQGGIDVSKLDRGVTADA